MNSVLRRAKILARAELPDSHADPSAGALSPSIGRLARRAYGTIRLRAENGLEAENEKTVLLPEKAARKNGFAQFE